MIGGWEVINDEEDCQWSYKETGLVSNHNKIRRFSDRGPNTLKEESIYRDNTLSPKQRVIKQTLKTIAKCNESKDKISKFNI